MYLSRRRSIFTLGDLYQTTTKSVSQSRTYLRNRQQADVFERDPFKVQSYNFHYAERPGAQFSQYTPGCFQSQLHALRQEQTNFLCKNGMSNTRFNENANKADKSNDFQRRELAASGLKSSTTEIFRRSSKLSIYEGTTKRRSVSRGSQTPAYTFPELSGCGSTGRSEPNEIYAKQTTEHPTTIQEQSISASRGNALTQRSTNSIIPQFGRMARYDATFQPRIHARETSKAVAAAVGTVGCPNTRAMHTAATKANERNFPEKYNGILVPLDPTTFRRRRSIAASEIGKFVNAGTQRTVQLSSSTLLRRNGAQTMQSSLSHRSQQHLSEPNSGDMAKSSVCTEQQLSPSENICITINGSQQRTPNENLVIKIESAVPVKITKSNAAVSPTSTSETPSPCGNRLNNLTAPRPKRLAPRGCNVTAKFSTDTVNKNKPQSKYCVDYENANLCERARECELFFEREDKRLRQLATRAAKSNNVGHVFGQGTTKEHNARCAPGTLSKQQARQSAATNAATLAAKARQLRNVYESGISSLRQLRESIGALKQSTKPSSPKQQTNRKASAQHQQSTTSHDDTSRISSNTTFTLKQPSKFRAQRSISDVSVHSCNLRLNTETTSVALSENRSRAPMNVSINLYPERRNKLAQ